MDCFENGRAVRLRSHYDKYLVAMEDGASVTQDRNGSDNRAIWTIERNTSSNSNIRFKSCFNRYLTASTERSNLGEIGRKVIQSMAWSSSSVDWNPIIDGDKVKFQTESGGCLRADGSVPPYRNTVTHKVPSRSPVHQHYLWHVEVLETGAPAPPSEPRPRTPKRKRDKAKRIARGFVEVIDAAGALYGAAGALKKAD